MCFQDLVSNRNGNRLVGLLTQGAWPRERGAEDRTVVECKLVKEGRSLSRTIEEGLEQTGRYIDISGAGEGHLVVFDLRPGRSWEVEGLPGGEGPEGRADHGLGGLRGWWWGHPSVRPMIRTRLVHGVPESGPDRPARWPGPGEGGTVESRG